MTPLLHLRKTVLNLSQQELARLLGVTQATVSRIETGKLPLMPRYWPILRTLGRDVLGAGWRESLLIEVPEINPQEPPSAVSQADGEAGDSDVSVSSHGTEDAPAREEIPCP